MKLSTMAAAAAVTLMSAGVAAAQPMGGDGTITKAREACAADMAKFCPDKKGKERHECMMAHRDEVSDGCKAAAVAMMKAHQDLQAQKPQ